MDKKIQNFKYTVVEAFNDCFYIIPDYQREYVWTEQSLLKKTLALTDVTIDNFYLP